MKDLTQPKFALLVLIPIVIIIGIILTYPTDSEIYNAKVAKKFNTLSSFENNLTADMTFEEIKLEFGEPQEDIGKGVHVYVYPLTGGGRVMIGYKDKIIYANHEDADGKLSRVLTPDSSTDTVSGGTAAQTTLANPASQYCIENGGTLKMEKDETGGEVGMCTLKSGQVCDEWAYFRQECGVEN